MCLWCSVIFEFLQLSDILIALAFAVAVARSLQGNQLTGHIPSVIGLMQALAVL